MSSAPGDWLESERGFAFAMQEVRRLTRRARPRRTWLVALALLASVLVGVWRARGVTLCEARIIMRFVELDKELTETVKAARRYDELIWTDYLAGPRLRTVIERFHLYPNQYARDPHEAIAAMREDLDVLIWRNDFAHYGVNSDFERSVRASIVWKHKDAEVAFVVIRALGDLIVEHQARRRREIYEAAEVDVRQATAAVARQLDEVREAQRTLRSELARTGQKVDPSAARMGALTVQRARATQAILRQKWVLRRTDREIAQSLGIEETSVRNLVARAQAAGLTAMTAELLDEDTLEQRIYGATKTAGRASTPTEMALRDLVAQERRLLEREDAMRNARTTLHLRAELERQQGGMRVDMIEPGIVLPAVRRGPVQIGLTCLGVFFFVLGMGGLFLGAFDSKIREAGDIRILGLPVIGALPPFRGDRRGSLAERLRAEDRLR